MEIAVISKKSRGSVLVNCTCWKAIVEVLICCQKKREPLSSEKWFEMKSKTVKWNIVWDTSAVLWAENVKVWLIVVKCL